MKSDKVQFIYLFNLPKKTTKKNPKNTKKTQKQNRIVIIFTVQFKTISHAYYLILFNVRHYARIREPKKILKLKKFKTFCLHLRKN